MGESFELRFIKRKALIHKRWEFGVPEMMQARKTAELGTVRRESFAGNYNGCSWPPEGNMRSAKGREIGDRRRK